MKKLDIAVPLIITQTGLETAEKFAREQHTKEKAQQVYFNTLAVYLVNNYLRILGIETDLKAGDSWNPAVHFAADTADLEIKNIGRLECRPLLGNQPKCDIPLEVMDERIGYVVVDINPEIKEANLLGFVEKLTTEHLNINDLLPIDNLLDHIHRLRILRVKPQIAQLTNWLNNSYESGWELLENLFTPSVNQLSFRFRNSNTVIRGKRIDLISKDEAVTLCVGVTPVLRSEVAIAVSLYPSLKNILPTGLQLMILNEEGKVEMQVEAGKEDQFLKFQFNAELQEIFSIKICYEDVSITEEFIV